MRNKLTQIGLVSGAVILTVLLYFANRKPPEKKGGKSQELPGVQSMEPFVNNALMTLQKADRAKWEEIMKNAEAPAVAQKSQWLDSAIFFWDMRKRPDIASVYSRKKAEATGAAKDWVLAGQRFYYAVRFVKDPAERPALYSNAIAAFEKGVQLDPANVDARIDLAASIVEGTADPMKGIGMLREIEKTDSMNLKLQLTMAMFSVSSGQWDRAIGRFNKVLQIDSTYLEAYLHLADAYQQKGDLENAIASLNAFSLKTDDMLAKTTINEYIEKLKKQQRKDLAR